jgi:hypothetical protein
MDLPASGAVSSMVISVRDRIWAMSASLPTVTVETGAANFAQHENVLAEIGLLHEGVRPDGLQEFLFGDHFAAAAHQHQERVECLRRDGDGPPFAEEDLLVGVHAKRSEFVHDLGIAVHGHWARWSVARQSEDCIGNLPRTVLG